MKMFVVHGEFLVFAIATIARFRLSKLTFCRQARCFSKSAQICPHWCFCPVPLPRLVFVARHGVFVTFPGREKLAEPHSRNALFDGRHAVLATCVPLFALVWCSLATAVFIDRHGGFTIFSCNFPPSTSTLKSSLFIAWHSVFATFVKGMMRCLKAHVTITSIFTAKVCVLRCHSPPSNSTLKS